MDITLISPYPDITAFGLRTLAACLKQRGHHVRLIFLPDPSGDDLVHGRDRYDERGLAALIPLCRPSSLVGISLMTNFFDGAVQITRALKAALPTPVLWGGIHPTIRPEESLEHADMVCLGEGEDAIVELAENMDAGRPYTDTANLWFKQDGRIIRNAVRALPADLDRYPRPDYRLDDHHALHEGVIRPLTAGLQKRLLELGTVSTFLDKIGYQTMTGRGCPHQCAYCMNDTLKSMYGAKGYLRWRSTAHVMAELEWVKQTLPYVGFIWISDDAFFARPLANLKEFCADYKRRINLPFSCLASPLTVTEEKMALMIDAGLISLQLGIQSASPRIQELFNRKTMTNEVMMRAIRTINRYRDRMVPPRYDFILDVPYETDEDRIASLRFIAAIPKPYRLQPFSLVLYPGTRLHRQAATDGHLDDEKRKIYSKSYTMRAPNYLNLLFTLAKGGRLPGWLLKALISPPAVALFNNRLVRPLVAAGFVGLRGAYRGGKRVLGK